MGINVVVAYASVAEEKFSGSSKFVLSSSCSRGLSVDMIDSAYELLQS